MFAIPYRNKQLMELSMQIESGFILQSAQVSFLWFQNHPKSINEAPPKSHPNFNLAGLVIFSKGFFFFQFWFFYSWHDPVVK